MSARVPDAATLLQAAGDYLEEDLLPTLTGYHRFQTRVALNVLRTVTRELRLAPEQLDAERARLVALVGRDGPAAELEAELATAIVEGRRALDAPELVDHLRRTLHESLAIDNPKWVSKETSNPRPQGAS